MIETIAAVNQAVNNFVWGVPAMVCIIGVGLLLSVRTRFLQIRKFPYAIKTTIGRMFRKKDASDGSMTPFQAVCTVLVLCFALGLLERADTVQPVFGEDSVRVPILMYHSILRDSARQGKYVISPAVLAADLDALQEKGYTAVTVSDLLAYVQDGADLPEKPVMLTFDDGYYNNYIYAYPLLKQRGMKAVVSIIGSQTALFTDNGEENAYWSHLRLDRLREMQDVF